MSERVPGRARSAAERWPQLEALWRFCRRWDAIVNRGTEVDDA